MGNAKKCCAECIGDRYLRREVFPDLSTETGTCAYCHSDDQQLLDPDALKEAFNSVIEIYDEDKAGETLGHWLRSDWAIFNPKLDEAHVKELLGDILDNGEVVRQRFAPAESYRPDALESWQAFRQELMHKNRYFPSSGIDLDRLRELLSHLLLSAEEIPPVWHRARTQDQETPFAPEKMGAPPKKKASNGRANPAGIPYLYLASTAYTAITELRPHTGQLVSVAEFTLDGGLNIIDLVAPRQTVTPFTLNEKMNVIADEDALSLLRPHIGFLEELGEELTRPVLPTAAAVDYTPSQYLCEFIKNCGYHGVRYKSSVGTDFNLALFDPSTATVGAVTPHHVDLVNIEHTPVI